MYKLYLTSTSSDRAESPGGQSPVSNLFEAMCDRQNSRTCIIARRVQICLLEQLQLLRTLSIDL